MGNEIAHYHDKEFLYRNWHYPPGWYFYDEEGDLYGPFLSKDQTERAFKLYLDGRMSGKYLLPSEVGTPKH